MSTAPVIDVFIPMPPDAPQMAAEPPIKTIWEASSDNDASTLSALLTSHPGQQDRLDESGWSPAICACRSDSIDALHCLAQYGADLDLNVQDGLTAAFAAAVSGSSRCLQFLINRDVHLDVPFRSMTALDWLLAPIRTSRTRRESRLIGNRLATARTLVLAGVSVQSIAICHHASRQSLCEWARREVLEEAAYFAFLCGVHHGTTATGVASPLATLNGSIGMYIVGVLPRHGPRGLRRLVRAEAVWTRETAEEAAFERHWLG